MSCKMGNHNHKERCQKYKTRGQREINKEKKAERDRKRIARFASRAARKPPKEPYVPKDEKERGDNKMSKNDLAYTPKQEHMTEYARRVSFLRRTQNQLDAEALELKKALEAANGKKTKKRKEKKKDDTEKD